MRRSCDLAYSGVAGMELARSAHVLTLCLRLEIS